MNIPKFMPLDFKPFENLPGLAELRDELDRNMTDGERIGSTFLSATLIPVALRQRGFGRWALLAAAGALLYRGITGRCPAYEALEIDRRHRRAGVSGNRGIRVESSVEIACPPRVLYDFWRNLSELPRVMRHIESITESGDFSHWKVKGPLGKTLEWDAEIINDHPGNLIAWQSLPGASVDNAGSVRFENGKNGMTHLKVAFDFDPPAGPLGAAVAKMLGGSPQRLLDEDLASFKEFAERELSALPRRVD
jgi:uncharacterized membrane protein